jgi:hypothetical protein
MSLILALKLTLVPALIGGVTLAGRRWGASVAGWLSAFPVVAGPVLLFIALEQGASFAAQAAGATLSAVLAILVFALGYAWTASRGPWHWSLAGGFVTYFAAVAALRAWAPALPIAALTVLVALLLTPRLFPRMPVQVAPVVARSSDMHLRMIAGAALVLLVTQFSANLGPRLSGLFAMFPVMSSVLVVFSHRHSGAAFAVNMLRGTVLGYYAFAVFCIALSLSLPVLGIGAAFSIALTGAVLVQALTRLALLRAARA